MYLFVLKGSIKFYVVAAIYRMKHMNSLSYIRKGMFQFYGKNALPPTIAVKVTLHSISVGRCIASKNRSSERK